MKNILFISWDGPQTSYMEGLFMPIFSEIQKQSNSIFHIVHFTWASSNKLNSIQKTAIELGLIYQSQPILRKPNSLAGSIFSLYKGINFLKNYIQENKIDIVLPRSTMPALMINRIQKQNFKILFDADGLPLEERVDFSGLNKNSRQFRFLKNQESKMILGADGVLTRSDAAIKFHSENLNIQNLEKFSVVTNGRNVDFFKPNLSLKLQKRQDLNISKNAKVFVYCGSLGLQYGFEEMITIFQNYININHEAVFLILTGNLDFAKKRIPSELHQSIILKSVPFVEIPSYLAVADIAFAIREPKLSMQGIAPIKLGEYLLMGIPTIASKGIGDTEKILKNMPNCFLFDHNNANKIENVVQFICRLKAINFDEIRQNAIPFFSIEKSAKSYQNALDKLV